MSPFDIYRTLKFIHQHPLNRSQKLSSLLNFIKWQLGTFILNKEVVIPWIDQCSFIAGKGERGLTGNIYGGLMEPEEMLFLLHTLRPNWQFIDVGANVGAYTLLASKVIGANSIAFEPIPDTVRKLKNQLALNGIGDKVTIFNVGVSDKVGNLHFTNQNSTTNHVSTNGKTKDTIEVEVLTLDKAIGDGNDPLFIKIDVEGFEYKVLKGATTLLNTKRVKALIVECPDKMSHQLLISCGLRPVSYDFFSRRVNRLDGPNKSNPNTIYILNELDINTLCSAAPKRTILTGTIERVL